MTLASPPIRIDLSMCSISIFLLKKTIFFPSWKTLFPWGRAGILLWSFHCFQCFHSSVFFCVWKWLVIHNHWKFPFERTFCCPLLLITILYLTKLWIRLDCGAIEQHDMVQPYMCSVLYGVGPKTDKALSRGLMNWELVVE
jgi:hypothetical protein